MQVATMFAPSRAIKASNGTVKKLAAKSQSYHVEITVNEREPEDAALRRFRRACSAAKIVYEVRRRQQFENPQDIKKRKMKERGIFKRLPDPQQWEEANGSMEPALFSDMFGEPEDIFGAEASYAPSR